uniref:Uncharacterized protein n=1 Tax=Seriola lalandi dorsalis TaxID=1841481 RepID=A0A3B4XSR0_SERLL
MHWNFLKKPTFFRQNCTFFLSHPALSYLNSRGQTVKRRQIILSENVDIVVGIHKM